MPDPAPDIPGIMISEINKSGDPERDASSASEEWVNAMRPIPFRRRMAAMVEAIISSSSTTKMQGFLAILHHNSKATQATSAGTYSGIPTCSAPQRKVKKIGTVSGCYLGHEWRFCRLGDNTLYSAEYLLFAEQMLKSLSPESEDLMEQFQNTVLRSLGAEIRNRLCLQPVNLN